MLAAVMLIFVIGMMAFAVDIGYLCMARGQAQACADAAALAAGWEMVGENRLTTDLDTLKLAAEQRAREYASMQDINGSVGGDDAFDVVGDVSFGRIENPNNLSEEISYSDPNNPNVVQVKITCNAEAGAPLPMFFARIFGINENSVSASATAVFALGDTVGFKPRDDVPCTLMPFVILEDDWDDLLANGGEDNWSYDPDTKTVSAGPDGIPEIRMFPEKEKGNNGKGKGGGGITPGNFGTVDIGNTGNGAPDLWRQIREGPSPEDLEYHDGELKLDPQTGTLELNGDCGVTASMKHALADVVGDPKTIMLYNDVVGQGNNTYFTICRFVGVRVMDFSMQGNANTDKYILVQPAMVQDSTAIIGDGDTSDFIGQPVHLVR